MKFVKNRFLIDDIENKDHPSDFEIVNDYSVLILRLPFIEQDKVDVVSYAFLVKNGQVYKYNRKTKEFDLLGDFYNLYEYLDTRIDKILAKILKLQLYISKMEDELYENEISRDFPKNWLRYKKELVLIERLMSHSLIAYERFMKFYKNDLDELAFKDLAEHIDRIFRFSKNAIDKLDYLNDFFKTKQDEKMNKIMFVLTIISGVFLPLSLIAGFFGMNTGGLPWSNDPNGTLKATVVSFILEIPILIILWKYMKQK